MIHHHGNTSYAGRDRGQLTQRPTRLMKEEIRISDRMEIMILFIDCRFLTLLPNKKKRKNFKYKSKHPSIAHNENEMEPKHPLHVNDDILIWSLKPKARHIGNKYLCFKLTLRLVFDMDSQKMSTVFGADLIVLHLCNKIFL